MILGIDGTNWVHQIWHAMQRPGGGSRGTSGLLETLKMRLTALVNHCRPAHVVACFDERSFRHDLWLKYKAHRPERPPELQRLLEAAPDALHHEATIARQAGYEADDCLATLAAIGRQRGQRVVLASPDKDLRQCLCEGQVSLLRNFGTERGELTKPDWMIASQLTETYGVRPDQWPLYQALAGDDGDNVPGCQCWGPKTIAAVLAKFDSLEAMLADLWKLPITARQRTTLQNWSKSAPLMLDLVTLRTDVAAVWDALR